MRTSHTIWTAGLSLLGFAVAAIAQPKDIRDSKDHPLVSRYPGSVITRYVAKEYDEYILPLGKMIREPGKPVRPERSQALEGKVTRIVYGLPKDRSVLEVYRNYEMALKSAGFEVLFACARAEGCGMGSFQFHQSWTDYWRYQDYRHLTAKRPGPPADVYVSLHVGEGEGISLDLIELKPLEAGMVTVDAEALARDIQRVGHASVYGIHFDFGKADVKPESEPTLREIARLLQQNAQLKLHVVGHTDSVGDLPTNMDLSRRRAQAVVQVLTTKYGIATERLRPEGFGPLAPVTSNDTEEGRAKNRRVELVKQ